MKTIRTERDRQTEETDKQTDREQRENEKRTHREEREREKQCERNPDAEREIQSNENQMLFDRHRDARKLAL